MRAAFGGILILLSMPIEAAEPCAEDHQEYSVSKSVEFHLGTPGSNTPLVTLSTDHGYVLLAEQSKFIPIADYRQNGRTGLGPYEFYWWLRSRQPIDLIDLDQPDHRFSHKYFHMMQLVDEGDFYVQASGPTTYLESVHLEWYSCMVGDSGQTGGRRLRTEGGKTIYWLRDWYF
jgi:hypothetical protein